MARVQRNLRYVEPQWPHSVHSKMIRTRWGQQLYVEHHRPAVKPRGTIVTTHGCGGHVTGRMGHVFEEMIPKGFQVLAYDQRGHGYSSGARCHVESFRQYSDDMWTIVQEARTLELPVFLLAWSMGSLVSLDFLNENFSNSGIRAATLISLPTEPLMPVAPWKQALAPWLVRILPRFTVSNGIHAEDLAENPDVSMMMETDPLQIRTVTVSWYLAFKKSREQFSKSPLNLISTPALFLHGARDRITSQRGTQNIFEKYPGQPKEIEIYPDCGHELINERAYPHIFDRIDRWFSRFI